MEGLSRLSALGLGRDPARPARAPPPTADAPNPITIFTAAANTNEPQVQGT
jgi:hypothetical protein